MVPLGGLRGPSAGALAPLRGFCGPDPKTYQMVLGCAVQGLTVVAGTLPAAATSSE